uniref:Uncharacterized protein n=1 Tax=mine drainage metagenome TaxID=410659 RepID=E6QP77_9ZZZZ
MKRIFEFFLALALISPMIASAQTVPRWITFGPVTYTANATYIPTTGLSGQNCTVGAVITGTVTVTPYVYDGQQWSAINAYASTSASSATITATGSFSLLTGNYQGLKFVIATSTGTVVLTGSCGPGSPAVVGVAAGNITATAPIVATQSGGGVALSAPTAVVLNPASAQAGSTNISGNYTGSAFESTSSSGGVFAYGSLIETNANGQTDRSPRSCTNLGADGAIYIGTNLDAPTAWTLSNINGLFTFAACYNNTSYGAPPIPQGVVWSIADRTGVGNYFTFDDTDFPVRFASAVNVGGYALLNPATGQLSADQEQHGILSVTTPATCTAFSACASGTVTFTTVMGVTTYECTANTETYPYVVEIASKTTTAVTFELYNLVAVASAQTVPIDYDCKV